MKIDFYKEKERLMMIARDLLAEAGEILREYLPDVAEELEWIREEVHAEILNARTAVGILADGGEACGAVL